jgi:hypothetical protein
MVKIDVTLWIILYHLNNSWHWPSTQAIFLSLAGGNTLLLSQLTETKYCHSGRLLAGIQFVSL